MNLLTLPLLALLHGGAPGDRHERPPREPVEETPERRERVEKRIRLMRLVEISERLELDDKAALKVNEALTRSDEKKRQAQEEMKAARLVVTRAAKGDAGAAKEVDQAVDQLIDGRKKLLDLDRELYKALGKDLSPKQRARLAIFLVEFQHKLSRLAHEAKDP